MKNILIFNDISGVGNCSLSANLPIFTKLGHYCMPVVTACYSCQTGFSNFMSTPNPNAAEFVRRICANATPDAFYVGFCNNTPTLKGAAEVVSDVLRKDTYLFVDPIMGDNGKLYPVFDVEYVEAMKSLVANADCISPNITEACLLCGVDYNSLTQHKYDDSYIELCKTAFSAVLANTGAKSAVVTGISQGDKISNLVFDGISVETVTTPRVDIDFSGTGDVFSSILLGELLNGKTLVNACGIAAEFVSKSAAKTERVDRRFGVDFVKCWIRLNNQLNRHRYFRAKINSSPSSQAKYSELYFY